MTNLVRFTFPSSVTNIPNNCFLKCTKLSQIDIPFDSNITSIGKWILHATLVTEFNIPAKVNNIASAFLEYSNLQSLSADRLNQYFYVQNSILIEASSKTVHSYPPKKSGPVTIPEGINSIGYASFSSCKITSVTFPTNLTLISDLAFQDTRLSEVIIPDSVSSIGGSAFALCSSLKYVKLPNKLVSLRSNCFKRTNLSSIDLPDTLKIINENCFIECPNLKEVVLPENLDTLNGKVFDTTTNLVFKQNSNFYINQDYVILTKDNSTLVQYIGGNEAKEISVHSNVNEIKASAFSNKNLLAKVIFTSDSKLRIIQNNAFYNCQNMKFIELPAQLTIIKDSAFFNCSKLESISLSFCDTIGISSFENCKNLKSVSMEDSPLTSIPKSCFSGCSSLTNIKLPSLLTTIDQSSFFGCSSLSKVTFHDKISSIGDSSFKQCNLQQVDISFCINLTEITENCFSDNLLLTEIKLPQNITTLGSYCFSNTGLKEFTCPLSLQRINSNSFMSCESLSTLIIPSDCKLNFIGAGSFRNCFSISNISCNSKNYKVITGALFDSALSSLILFPPASDVKFFSLPGTTTNIGEGAFMSCINLLSIMIPSNSVQQISQNAFEGCRNLKMINIPICVKIIGQDAFKDCDQLSCGCQIENRNKTFLFELIEKSKLPRRCIKNCEELCSFKNMKCITSQFLIHPFIVMLL
ncbi:surface antigen BspA-like [Trichomonas vaginalis G3]|uniref:Surface antigen BspA-like n=1 Tax=Trichomonas vaginalis (strain ATCC PRA-98 / G3) TaxID=412133 RepID=A2FBQ9_TRIV3|nr:antigen BSP-related family [Trichomonas vaginalis G3]EAX97656.1 surface antigen BspA-like [Trichomonas vaginalis G3]KAI5510373.1 antigen BSP-related family [Trichomonas vaginalis G3]|eukprot:XP_001310586.1 surface antigen BspA-like [Trichomonas vaginalis G3]